MDSPLVIIYKVAREFPQLSTQMKARQLTHKGVLV